MFKLNNKGFAIASILYSIMVLFLMLLLSILGMLGSRKATLDKNKKDILIELNSNGNRMIFNPKELTISDSCGRNNIEDALMSGVYAIDAEGNTIGSEYIRYSGIDLDNIEYKTYNIVYTANNGGTTIVGVRNVTFVDGTTNLDELGLPDGELIRCEPTAVSLTTRKTTNSIIVTAIASNHNDGIDKFEFSKDGGLTWTNPQEENIYTFDGLTTGTYSMKVRLTNTITHESVLSDTVDVVLDGCVAPSYTFPNNDGDKWTQAKVINIINEAPSGYHIEYATVAEPTDSDWVEGNSVVLRSNGNIVARATDGTNTCNASTQVVEMIDDGTAELSVTASGGINRISITATVSNNLSGVYRYKFSVNNGSSWTSEQENNTYSSSTSSGTKYPKAMIYTNAWYNTVSAYRDDAKGIVEASGESVLVSAPTATNTPTPTDTPSPTPTCCQTYCQTHAYPDESYGACTYRCEAFGCDRM